MKKAVPVYFNPKSKFYLHNAEAKWFICDLDGTIFDTEPPYYELKKLRKGAKKWLKKIKEEGFNIIIFTARHSTEHAYIEWSLEHFGIPFKMIITGKVWGLLYYDDRAMTHTDWEKDGPAILKRLKEANEKT